jgi:hypothetical protein
MGLYCRNPELQPFEKSQFRNVANRATPWRAVGGLLFVTKQRVVFKPHRVDALFKAKPWSRPRADVMAVNVESGAPHLSVQNWGSRLRFELVWGILSCFWFGIRLRP